MAHIVERWGLGMRGTRSNQSPLPLYFAVEGRELGSAASGFIITAESVRRGERAQALRLGAKSRESPIR
jgi:hypothetical protein